MNTSTSAIDISRDGKISNDGGTVSWSCISASVTRIEVKSSKPYVGAKFTNSDQEYFYGVWEYLLSGSLINSNVLFDLKGIGRSEGINWSNARAPFFISSAGYGVYVDTPDMGAYDFNSPGVAQFMFNTSSLTYYIITPQRKNDFKSIIEDDTGLSARNIMPPDSSYGPHSTQTILSKTSTVMLKWQNRTTMTLWITYTTIRSMPQPCSLIVCCGHFFIFIWLVMMTDPSGPYGTGNYSYGNFDFDPKYYPDPERLVRNLSDY